MYDKDALQGKTLAELREIGRQFGIKAQMRKQELADKIIELSAQQNVAAVSTESEQTAVEQPQRRPGRPRKQNVVAEEKSAVKIGRVIQGEPYRKQRGRRAKDNKENGELLHRRLLQRMQNRLGFVKALLQCEEMLQIR